MPLQQMQPRTTTLLIGSLASLKIREVSYNWSGKQSLSTGVGQNNRGGTRRGAEERASLSTADARRYGFPPVYFPSEELARHGLGQRYTVQILTYTVLNTVPIVNDGACADR